MPNRYVDFLLGIIADLENLLCFDASLTRDERDRSFELIKKLEEVVNNA